MNRAQIRVFAAVLAVAAIVYLLTRTPQTETATTPAVEPAATDAEREGAAAIDPNAEAVRRSLDSEVSPGEIPAVTGTKVLRVVLEGITEDDAEMTTVTVTGVDKRAFDRRLATDEQWDAYVRWVHRTLNQIMGSQLPDNGTPIALTNETIRAFQQREGLPTSGRVGVQTERALLRYDDTQSYVPRWPAEIKDSWSFQGATGEFDLDPFLAYAAEQDEGLRVDALELEVDHPMYLVEWARAPLSGGVKQENGQTIYEVRVRLVPVCVIHGLLTRADGTPATEGMAGALLLANDFPIDDVGNAVECEEDGAFAIRVPASGRYALTGYEDGMRPTTLRVDAVVGTRVDVGALELEPGHAITGRVLRGGHPLADAKVAATPPTWNTAAEDVESGMHSTVYEGRTFASPVRSVHFLWLPPDFASRAGHSELGSRRNGRFELAAQEVTSDSSGAFSFRGLGAGDYLIRMRGRAEAHDSLPGYWDHTEADWMFHIHGDLPAKVVRAPKNGVELEYYWTLIHFNLVGDINGEDRGRLMLRTRTPGGGTPVDENGVDLRLVADPYARNLNFTPEFQTWDAHLSGNESTFVLAAPPNLHITGEVRFPGREAAPLDFWTPKSGGEIEVPVDLTRLEEPASLVIEVQNSPEEIPGAFRVELWRTDQADFPAKPLPIELAAGQLQLEDLTPGKYRVRVHPGKDYYSAGLFHHYAFEIELRSGREARQSVLLPKGAGLRVTVRGADGAPLTGEYEFSDDLGLPATLNLSVRNGDFHGASSWKLYPHESHVSFNELHPGRYGLLLRSPGYEEHRVTVELRAGEYEELDITMSK